MRQELRIIVAIVVLWLVAVAALGDGILLGVALTVPGLAAMALSARNAIRGRFASVSPWACCALASLGLLCLVALANVHLHEFTGGGPGCDSMAQVCTAQPLQGLAHALALILFATAGILTLRLIRVTAAPARRDRGPRDARS